MRKLRLDVEELEVQTFATNDHDVSDGTVVGAERTLYCNTYEFPGCEEYTNGPGTCPADSCDNCPTWECVSTDVTWQYLDGVCV